MNEQKVYKYGFFSMIAVFLLYLFNGKVKSAVDAGANKATEATESGIGKVKTFFGRRTT